MFVMLLPIFLYTALTVISVTNSSFALYIGQLTADYQYPLQRMIRFVVLPLHQFYDFTKLGAWDCMVDNPLYVPGMIPSNTFDLLSFVNYLCSFTTYLNFFSCKLEYELEISIMCYKHPDWSKTHHLLDW